MGKAYTLLKLGVPEKTFKTLITQYNKEAEEYFKDKRQFNKGKAYIELDEELVKYIERRSL